MPTLSGLIALLKAGKQRNVFTIDNPGFEGRVRLEGHDQSPNGDNEAVEDGDDGEDEGFTYPKYLLVNKTNERASFDFEQNQITNERASFDFEEITR